PSVQTGRSHRLLTANRRLDSASPCHPDQPGARHQASDPFLADRSARFFDLGENSRCSVWRARGTMDARDLIEQKQVLLLVGRWFTLEPGIITAPRDLQYSALQIDRVEGLVRLYEFVEPSGITPVSRANQAAAFFRISRSCFSCRFSRRKRLSYSRPL